MNRAYQNRRIQNDSRSRCYQIENFDRDKVVTINAVELLVNVR